MALPSDSCRKEQLLASFAQREHPASKFIWGNIKTLRDDIADDKLYQELHRYRKRHYSAHRMTLAVQVIIDFLHVHFIFFYFTFVEQAKLPLDTLEDYVTRCFSDVENNGLPAEDFGRFKSVDAFDTSEFRRMYRVKPVKDLCQVSS